MEANSDVIVCLNFVQCIEFLDFFIIMKALVIVSLYVSVSLSFCVEYMVSDWYLFKFYIFGLITG
jgi:hypothetical protein